MTDNEFVELLKAVMSPEMIKTLASLYKKLYDAYLAEGFTPEQAMELLKMSNISYK